MVPSLGCVIPASWPPLAVAARFTQPRVLSLADSCTVEMEKQLQAEGLDIHRHLLLLALFHVPSSSLTIFQFLSVC